LRKVDESRSGLVDTIGFLEVVETSASIRAMGIYGAASWINRNSEAIHSAKMIRLYLHY
jgi:hypothetical protein